MSTSPLNNVIQHFLADIGPDESGAIDGELIARFVSSRDGDALAALVRRHAAMVWGVCCRLLPHHDAEDAFQATFLVLVRKAGDVPKQAVANWLYGVARQTAVRLRATAAKRGRREAQVMNMPEPADKGQERNDVRAELDLELSRLPEHYRGVLVLCDLGGLTRKEAARQLGIPEGSVASRLAKGRILLAKRLIQRGVVLSGGSVAALLSAGLAAASAPPALVAFTIKTACLLAAGRAAGVISAKVIALTEGTVKAMCTTKIKSALAVVLVVAALASAAGLIYQARAAGQPTSPPSERAALSTTPNEGVREAATRAVRLIDQASASFLTKRTCVTCHTQTLSAMVLRDARKVGIEIDEANFKRQYLRAIEDQTGTRVDTKGYALWALDIGQYAPDEKTEVMVEYVLNLQKHQGTWTTTVDRPPAEASNFTTNYVALRGLNRYGTAKQRDAIATRTTAVKKWLESASAVDTEDQVFRLRLAHELKLPSDKVDHFVQRLLSEQDADGGWAQNRQMKPDAYATGSVLVALYEAGGMSCQHSAWQRGLGYLLRIQQPDGSWHVVSRAKPIMEYFESGFPHGKDQFISTFATGWATEALLMSLAQEAGAEKPAQPKEQPAKSDRERMVGNWFIMNDDSGRRKGEMWVITEDRILMNAKDGGANAHLYSHRLDAAKDPKHIDITVTQVNGPLVGVIKGIYALDGDELRLSLGGLDKDRPAAFPEKPKLGELLILQRNPNGTWPPKPKEKPAAKNDHERMVGEWVIKNADSQRQGQRWVINKEHILMNYYGPGAIPVQYHFLDASKDPKQIDIALTKTNGPNAIKGIYVLDGDELRLCLGERGKDRPAAFPEKPAPGTVLILHRQRPESPASPDATKKDEKPLHFVEKPDLKPPFNWSPHKVDGELTELSILVPSKAFIADVVLPGKSRFRELIDPRYLKKHGLTDRDIAYEILDHQGLRNYHVADDLRTVLFQVHSKGGGWEMIMVRWVVYEGHLYISPEKAPDPKTGSFKLWILRTKVN